MRDKFACALLHGTALQPAVSLPAWPDETEVRLGDRDLVAAARSELSDATKFGETSRA